MVSQNTRTDHHLESVHGDGLRRYILFELEFCHQHGLLWLPEYLYPVVFLRINIGAPLVGVRRRFRSRSERPILVLGARSRGKRSAQRHIHSSPSSQILRFLSPIRTQTCRLERAKPLLFYKFYTSFTSPWGFLVLNFFQL